MELSDWVISTLERTQAAGRTKSAINRMGDYALESLHLDCTGRLTKKLKEAAIVIKDTIKVGQFYLTTIKILAIISIFLHASTHILFHRFDTVAGYNLDFVMDYLVFVVVSSKLAISLLHLVSWKLLDGYCYKRPKRFHLLIKMCTIAFPVHYGILELSRLRRLIREHENDLKDVFNDMKKREEVRKTRKKFLSVLQMIKDAQNNSIQVNKFYIQVQLLGTLLERMPLCAILASLFIVCRGKYQQQY